jgi:outer membrane protein assembly factor BamB
VNCAPVELVLKCTAMMAQWLPLLTLVGALATAASLCAQDGTQARSPHVSGGAILSTPAIGPDGTIYSGSRDRRVYALAPEGAVRWQFLTGDWVDASPALNASGDTLYAASWDGKLYALNTANGSKRWDYATGAYIASSPAVAADGTIYFGAGDSSLHALTPTGTLKWRFPAADWIDSSPAIAPDGTVIFASWDGHVYAVDTAGNELWRYANGGPIVSSPAIGPDGTVYIGTSGGALLALSSTGSLQWSFPTQGDVEAAPAIGADGSIYVGSVGGRLYCLNPDGSERWRFPAGAAVMASIYSSPTLRADGSILLGAADFKLYCLEADGTLRWTFTTGDFIDGSVAIGPAPDHRIYFGSYDRRLYFLHGAAPLAPTVWPKFRRTPDQHGRAPVLDGTERLLNIATRARVGTGADAMFAGFITQGGAKNFLVRAAGPALTQFGVPGVLAQPRLTIFGAPPSPAESPPELAQNVGWGNNPAVAATGAAVGAFPFAPDSADSALTLELAAGLYSARVDGVNDGTVVALVEIYDTGGPGRLVNLSTRAFVGTGGEVMIPGVVIGGSGPRTLLLRAVGPTIGQSPYNVPGVLTQPVLSLFVGPHKLLENRGWTTNAAMVPRLQQAALDTGAFALEPGAADSAVLVTLMPGLYTVQVSGVGGGTGVALVEVYELPSLR